MKCICLIRVSTGHQDLESQTIKVREEAIKDGYTEQDIIVIEDIESAVKLSEEERNGLNRMKQYIESDSSINCVYTYEVSRISRRPEVLYSIRDYLINHSVNLVIMKPYFKMLNDDGTMSETSSLYFGIFSAMSEQEGYLRKARIKKAVEKYKAEGRHTGGNMMFGYTTNYKHEYIPNPETAPIVRMIFQWYVNDNMSIRTIARELWERGVKLWTCKTERKTTSLLTMCTNVNNILHRREYIGEGRPRLITDELFYEAQDRMKNKTICKNRHEVIALLRGMIYNKANGYLLSANNATKFYYSKRVKGPAISYECADKVIWEWMCEKYSEYKTKTNSELTSKLQHEHDVIDKKLMSQFNRRNELVDALDRLEERIVMGKISTSKGDELGDKLCKEIEELDRQEMVLQEERIRLNMRIDEISTLDIDLECVEFDEKVKLIHLMIKKIYIERIDRTKCRLYIESKISTEMEQIKIDTYHKCRI